MIDAGKLAAAGCKYLGVPYSEMDCQAFVERCLRDCGIDMNLAGSNAWYRYVTENGWTGTPEECKREFGRIPPGAFLFILLQDGKEPQKYKGDGIGNASHIGIYTSMSGAEMVQLAIRDGDAGAAAWNFGDGAINSSSSRGHVCTSKFSGKSINGGWNRIGLWRGAIDYGLDGDDVKVTYQAKVIGGNLNLRAAPDKSAERIDQIPDGTVVTVTEDLAGWSKVIYDGQEGYAMSMYLEEVKPEQDTEMILVPKEELEKMYDMIGGWLGLRG